MKKTNFWRVIKAQFIDNKNARRTILITFSLTLVFFATCLALWLTRNPEWVRIEEANKNHWFTSKINLFWAILIIYLVEMLNTIFFQTRFIFMNKYEITKREAFRNFSATIGMIAYLIYLFNAIIVIQSQGWIELVLKAIPIAIATYQGIVIAPAFKEVLEVIVKKKPVPLKAIKK